MKAVTLVFLLAVAIAGEHLIGLSKRWNQPGQRLPETALSSLPGSASPANPGCQVLMSVSSRIVACLE
jgi:hypothetical protein